MTTAPSPSPSIIAATDVVKPPHNWASVQLNLIMLPVGVFLVVILGLSACMCNYLRKRRLKRLERELKRQRKKEEMKHHKDIENGGNFINFGSSPTHNGYPGLPREKSFSPKNRVSPINDHTHPAIIKKEKRKQKRRLKRSMSQNSHYTEKESSVKYVRESITPDRMNYGTSRNKSITSKSTTSGSLKTQSPGNQVSGIPVAMKPKSRESKRSRSLSFESKSTLKSKQNHQTVDMDSSRSSKDRKKWEIPQTGSIEYDKKGSLRLPPLSELRTAKSA